MKRRRFLTVGAAAVTVGVAGCTGDDDDGGGDGGDDPTPTDTATPDDDPTPEPTDEPTDTPDDADEPALGEAVTSASSFAIEMVMTSPDVDEELVMDGRVYEDDMYWRMDYQGETIESYTVDGDEYLVTGGICFLDPSGQQQPYDPEEEYDPDAWGEDVESNYQLTPAETTTLDGEEMYVYEFADQQGYQVTYYVSVASGHLRRVEFDTGYVNYHSWGEVDPIEPPDMECQSF